MAVQQNPHSLLFLFEGETEEEFYRKLFDTYIPAGHIRRNYSNLKGNFNITKKTERKINLYLDSHSFSSCQNIHVFIAYDRDGTREKEPCLDVTSLRKTFIKTNSRVISINEIIATQDLESWFFHDIEGIYNHLRAPHAQRNLKAYPNVEATNNKTLSTLFYKHNKLYQKGKRAHGFIDNLNIEKIYNNVQELKTAIAHITELCKHK